MDDLYLVSKASFTRKLARWTLLLQEFEFDIVHQPGVQHAVADYLSWLESGEAPTGVKDDFFDGGLLKIIAELGEEEDPDKWMVDMEFVLSNGIPSEEMGREEQKKARSKTMGILSIPRQLVPQVGRRNMEKSSTVR